MATHLEALSSPARVFGDPMSAWRDNMPKGMFLKSAPDASDLSSPRPGSTLRDYVLSLGRQPLAADEPIPIDLFLDYGLWFAQRHVPHVEQECVSRVSRCGTGFALTLASGETTRASSVVVASGHLSYAYIPPELLRLTEEAPSAEALVSHSSHHRDFAAFAGRRVAVVGGGQSALESAALLHEAGADVVVLVRGDNVEWNEPPSTAPATSPRQLLSPRSGLGRGWKLFFFGHGPALVRHFPDAKRGQFLERVLGPSGAWWLRERVEGRIGIDLGCSISTATAVDRTVRLAVTSEDSQPNTLEVDHVLAATGYRIRIDDVPFLEPDLCASVKKIAGAPRLDASFESSVPGLYFTGLSAAPTFGPVLRFVCGARFASTRISAAIARNERRLRAASAA